MKVYIHTYTCVCIYIYIYVSMYGCMYVCRAGSGHTALQKQQ
jgi:hypothetical protein